jgi:AraC-like DNA-binding protein
VLAFEAPMLALAPEGCAHGFEVRPGSDGLVVSASDDLWREAAGEDDDLAALMAAARMLSAGADDAAAHGLRLALEGLRDEHRALRPGRAAAIAAHLKLALVHAARLVDRHDGRPAAHEAERELTARFRALLEKRYREDWGVGDYARALKVQPAALNAACRAALGRSVLAAVHARRLSEAKRLLLHTQDSVAEVGYRAGFEDPAYFSRFFKKHAGASPQAWRAGRPSAP